MHKPTLAGARAFALGIILAASVAVTRASQNQPALTEPQFAPQRARGRIGGGNRLSQQGRRKRAKWVA